MNPKYRRMLKLMQAKESASPRYKKREKWFLYILECRDGSFYTGITNNLERRIQAHQDGRASKFTRTRRPVKLLYHEPCKGRTAALVRECAVKTLPRKKKEALVLWKK